MNKIIDPAECVEGLQFILVGKCYHCGKKVELSETIKDLDRLRSEGIDITMSKGSKLVGLGTKWFCSQKCHDKWWNLLKFKRNAKCGGQK